jgi:DNA-binding NarL/FixJ family response regulator
VPSEVIVAARSPGAPPRLARRRRDARRGRAAGLAAHPRVVAAPRGRRYGGHGVVIEPAKASEVAPLIVEAYELTPREVDVTRALARGLTTSEIARELHLSRYTVQDHLKSVYEKAGVSSRGELVAKMFADHYHDAMAEGLHRAPAMQVAPLAAAA